MDKKQIVSIEELAFLMNSKKNQAYAKELLSLIYDELDKTDVEKILLTAAHSLFARGLLNFNQQTKEIQLQPDIEKLFNTICNPHLSLLLQKVDFINETTITANIYIDNTSNVTYQSLDGIVHKIEAVSDDRLFLESKNLLQIVFQEEEKESKIIGTLPNHMVQNIEELFPLSIQEGKTMLIKNGFNSLYAENFIKDLKTTQSIYTILRLDTTEKDEVISDNGFFVIESPNTQWLLTRNIINDSFDITYLTKNLFGNEIEKLIKH
ncbi:hypothetical protein OF830_01040 [Bacillus paramycoides]|uniref:hypothetical protein n=1 Tax=Bacillus paramycoides TaxID=2026194 RepID=UPI002244E6C4|nr:hypothetical protein [Bacillus paramycoides]MCW9129576.1 hypothetical protein [Bacillus paramycoides]